MSTRERKLKFLSDFRLDIRTGVAKMILQYGEGWLTDEQLDDLVRDEVANWKRSQRMSRRNRAQRRNAENRERVAG